MKIKIFLVMVMFLVMISIVNGGVTMPSPTSLELKPGEAGEFRFGIENPGSEAIKCNYRFKKELELPVEWSEEEPVIDAGTKKFVYGLVTVPIDAYGGTYSGSLYVNCGGAITPLGGSAVSIAYDNLLISVRVVSERTRGNPYDPVEEEEPKSPIGIIFYIILTVIVLYYWLIFLRKEK